MTLTINNRFTCEPSGAHPGEYIVSDTTTTRLLSACVRTVKELHEVVRLAEKEDDHEA